MEQISEIIKTEQTPIVIDVCPYLADHHHEGKSVLPAVEIMNALAISVTSQIPGANIATISNARFDKFLFIPNGMKQINAISELSIHKNGDISAKLITKNRVKDLPITRVKEHAVVTFSQQEEKEVTLPRPAEVSLSQPFYEVPSRKIYEELVPFGPSYHNLDGPVLLSRDGASARTRATENIVSYDKKDPLGSPFPLDATFHAACVWGQRYENIIAFPVGIGKRTVHHNTRPESVYHIHVDPMGVENDGLIFDMFIKDDGGLLYESLTGVLMKDVSAGRLHPPTWITLN